jgi:Zn-dependent protease
LHFDPDVLLVLPVLVLSIVVHECAHGLAALWCGDTTARDRGRLTLNPLPHIDPWLTIVMPALLWYASKGAFVFGGAKPVQVRPDRYHNYRRGDIIVSAAGVATNLGLTVLCTLGFMGIGLLARALPAGTEVISTGQRVLYWGVVLNLMLGFFNLIPIPPLDGSHILYHLLPRSLQAPYRALQRFGFLILFAVMFFLPRSIIQVLLVPAYAGLALFQRLVAPYAVGTHWNIFPS